MKAVVGLARDPYTELGVLLVLVLLAAVVAVGVTVDIVMLARQDRARAKKRQQIVVDLSRRS